MAVYTCLDMVRDCRAGRREGWEHFITEYFPFCQAVIEHYLPERSGEPDILRTLMVIFSRPGCTIFEISGVALEREFLLGLRNTVLEQLRPPRSGQTAPDTSLLAGFSALERQIGWLETMGYEDRDAARMLNLDQQTVASARAKLHEVLQGAGLFGTVLPAAVEDCIIPRLLADYTDGRLTWQTREAVERHLCGCWRCVDLLCRLRESEFLMHRRLPLQAEQIERLREVKGLPQQRKSFWRKVLPAGRK